MPSCTSATFNANSHPHRFHDFGSRKNLCAMLCWLILALAAALPVQEAIGALEEQEVLLLYTDHPDFPQSMAIRNAYIAVHPKVQQLELQLPYNVDAQHVSNPDCTGCSNPVTCAGCSIDSPCCSCPTIATVPANNEYFITLDLYETNVRQPILNYIAQLPPEDRPLAIVTTRGLPAAISTSFYSGVNHSTHCIKASFEAKLAAIGFPSGEGGMNPYLGKRNLPFRDFLETPDSSCGVGGQSVAGKMYLVSRLDSSDRNGNGSHVDEITP